VEISLTNPTEEALRAAAHGTFLAMDLTMKVLINRTDVEFITSNNPVVLYNQCFEEADPGVGGNVGLANTGLQIFLPLSARHLLVLYDRKAYKVGHKKSDHSDVSNRDDVRQFNDLQYLNCVENLYAYSGFTSADIFCLEQRNGRRIRTGLPILDEKDQGIGPDGNTRVRLQIMRADHRIKLSVQPIRQLLRLSKEALNSSPKPVRDPKRVRFFKEFQAAVKANRYAADEIKRFIEDRTRAQSSTGSIPPPFNCAF
jgi:two-component sensor histidine kinase